MKRLLFLLLLVGHSALGQSYIPMLGNLSQWRAVTCNNGCGTDDYHASGDTLVDGLHYQILDGFHYIQRNFLIREDVLERKVYLKTLVAHTLLDEYPLYDFSLEDGDTTDVYNPISPLPEDGGKFVLDSIVSRALEDGDHRFFYLHAVNPILSQSSNTVWVEGVGSLTLINSPGAEPTPSGHLGCAFHDGVLRYAKLDSISGCSTASIESETLIPVFRLNPNAFQDAFRLQCPALTGTIDLKIFSIDGRLIFSDSSFDSESTTIVSQDFPKGLLIINGETNNGSSFQLRGVKL